MQIDTLWIDNTGRRRRCCCWLAFLLRCCEEIKLEWRTLLSSPGSLLCHVVGRSVMWSHIFFFIWMCGAADCHVSVAGPNQLLIIIKVTSEWRAIYCYYWKALLVPARGHRASILFYVQIVSKHQLYPKDIISYVTKRLFGNHERDLLAKEGLYSEDQQLFVGISKESSRWPFREKEVVEEQL